jgi:hypothetical protein
MTRNDPKTSPVPSYPTVEMIIDAVADWVSRCRQAMHPSADFAACGPDEVRRIASDLGIDTQELQKLSAHGPHSADLLQKMLPALGLDSNALTRADPALMRDLQRLCVTCGNKRRCQHDLAEGTAAGGFSEYCPNAFTLDALLRADRSKDTLRG